MDDSVPILLMKQFSSIFTAGMTSPLWSDRLLMRDSASGILKH